MLVLVAVVAVSVEAVVVLMFCQATASGLVVRNHGEGIWSPLAAFFVLVLLATARQCPQGGKRSFSGACCRGRLKTRPSADMLRVGQSKNHAQGPYTCVGPNQ